MQEMAASRWPLTDLHTNGFAVVPKVLSDQEIDELGRSIATVETHQSTRRGSVYGGRNLLDVTRVREAANSAAVRSLVEPVLGADASPVRALFFDKTPQANWPVLWHQDRTIALAERHELTGWGPWSIKAGIPHVHAPAEVLEGMLAVRLHLDDCGRDNGPLRVLPKTHTMGKLSREQIEVVRREIGAIDVMLDAGSAVS